MRVAGSFENKIKPTEKKWPLFFSRLPLHRQMTSSLSECAGFQFVKWPLRRVYTRQWKLVHRPCSVTGFFFQQKGNIRRFPSPKRGQRELRYWKTTNRMMAASWQGTWWTFPFGLTRQSDETSIRLQNWPMMAIEGKEEGQGHLNIRTWHQILHVDSFFLLPLAAQANGGAREQDRRDESESNADPSDHVRPIVISSRVILENLSWCKGKHQLEKTKQTFFFGQWKVMR